MTVSGQIDQRSDSAAVGSAEKIACLTGIRAVAALLVVATHAAYTTGKYPRGYLGLVYSRMEIGVPLFFVLSGFLLFSPWVKAAAQQGQMPSVLRYFRHRCRRIMPAYVVTVLGAYAIYHFRTAGPNPGHTWYGLVRTMTLTQIYTDNYLFSYVHQGLTQMWSLAVEVAFYLVLPVLGFVLVVVLCQRRWRPWLLLMGVLALAFISPAWLALVHTTTVLPDSARLWLPGYLAWFLGGMALAVLAVMGQKCYGFIAVSLALISYFIVSTPLAGEPTTSPTELGQALVKTVFYAVIAVLMIAPLALADRGWYARFLGTRPMVWLGEISYEIFLVHLIVMEVVMVELLKWPVYTGSMPVLFGLTVGLSIPVAWLLHRCTRVS